MRCQRRRWECHWPWGLDLSGFNSLLKSFGYTRSEMERAILSAGQFAHASEDDVRAMLDDEALFSRRQVRYVLADRSVTRVDYRYYHAEMVCRRTAKEFGTLCPVCLGVIEGDMPRWTGFGPLFASWLYFDGDDLSYPRGSTFGDWENRGYYHHECRHVASAIDALEDMERVAIEGDVEDMRVDRLLNRIDYVFRNRGSWRPYLKALSEGGRSRQLRFNPRTAPIPGAARCFTDTRYLIDELAEFGDDVYSIGDYGYGSLEIARPSFPQEIADMIMGVSQEKTATE